MRVRMFLRKLCFFLLSFPVPRQLKAVQRAEPKISKRNAFWSNCILIQAAKQKKAANTQSLKKKNSNSLRFRQNGKVIERSWKAKRKMSLGLGFLLFFLFPSIFLPLHRAVRRVVVSCLASSKLQPFDISSSLEMSFYIFNHACSSLSPSLCSLHEIEIKKIPEQQQPSKQFSRSRRPRAGRFFDGRDLVDSPAFRRLHCVSRHLRRCCRPQYLFSFTAFYVFFFVSLPSQHGQLEKEKDKNLHLIKS